jgi:hypothetical protein
MPHLKDFPEIRRGKQGRDYATFGRVDASTKPEFARRYKMLLDQKRQLLWRDR